MTDTHEAVRLADWLENDIPPHDQGQLLQAAAILRRVPELEAELAAAKLSEAFHDRQAPNADQKGAA